MNASTELRALRERNSLTLREVAAVAGYSVSWVHYVEHGKRTDPRHVVETAILRLVGGARIPPARGRMRP